MNLKPQLCWMWALLMSLTVAVVPVTAQDEQPAPETPREEEPAEDDVDIYVPPAQGAPESRVIGAVRSESSAVIELFAAMIPRQMAVTISAQPVLYVYMSHDTPHAIRLGLTNLDTFDRKLKATIPGPHKAGILAFDLAKFDITLDPHVEYEWSAVVMFDARRPSENPFASGWIKRIEAGEELQAALEAGDAAAQVKALAGRGIWYDAFHRLQQAIARDPDNDKLLALRRSLLSSPAVGLDERTSPDSRSVVERLAE